MILDVQAGEGGLSGYFWTAMSCLQVALEAMLCVCVLHVSDLYVVVVCV